MRTFRNIVWGAPVLSSCLLLVASVAGAQDTRTQGPMTVERVKSGFLVAPDFKVTTVNRRTSTLAGAYAGWLNDGTLFIGGGGYCLADRSRDREMAYGGVILGLMAHADRRVGFGVKTLVGGGRATLTTVFAPAPGRPGVRDTRSGRSSMAGVPARPAIATVGVRSRSRFSVTEPEADVLLTLTRHVRLTAGVGYRLVGAERNAGHRLRGVSGSVALQIGGGL